MEKQIDLREELEKAIAESDELPVEPRRLYWRNRSKDCTKKLEWKLYFSLQLFILGTVWTAPRFGIKYKRIIHILHIVLLFVKWV